MERLNIYSKPVKILALALDDDEDDLMLIKEAIVEAGFQNFQFYTRVEDLRKNVTPDVHLIILDHQLGGITGFDVMAEMKKINSEVFTIICSGASCEVLLEYMNKGADKACRKTNPNYQKELMEFVHEGLKYVKDQFDFWQPIITVYEKYKQKA